MKTKNLRVTAAQTEKLRAMCARLKSYGFTDTAYTVTSVDSGLSLLIEIAGKLNGAPYEASYVAREPAGVAAVLAMLADNVEAMSPGEKALHAQQGRFV